jgi:hypothetical protein
VEEEDVPERMIMKEEYKPVAAAKVAVVTNLNQSLDESVD